MFFCNVTFHFFSFEEATCAVKAMCAFSPAHGNQFGIFLFRDKLRLTDVYLCGKFLKISMAGSC